MISYAWLFFNHMLFHQLQPVFFTNRLDLSLNILFLTGIQHAVVQYYFLKLLLDILYLMLPFLLLFFINSRRVAIPAMVNALFNLVYALLVSSFTPLSIAGFAGWILLPLVFIPYSARGFYFSVNTMRYIFLLFFFSAGLWKIRTGGIFNAEQMSAILLKQHTAYLVQAPGDWFTTCINYLVIHQNISFTLYLLATAAELVFVIGFFTKKFDRVLMLVFLLFVLFDFILMRINYFSWVAFLGCLWFSAYTEPGTENERQ